MISIKLKEKRNQIWIEPPDVTPQKKSYRVCRLLRESEVVHAYRCIIVVFNQLNNDDDEREGIKKTRRNMRKEKVVCIVRKDLNRIVIIAYSLGSSLEIVTELHTIILTKQHCYS